MAERKDAHERPLTIRGAEVRAIGRRAGRTAWLRGAALLMALIFLLGLKEGPAALLVPLASLPFLASTYLLSWFGGGWLAAEVIRSKRGGRAVVAAAFALLVIDGGIAGQAMIGAALNAPTADEKFFDDLFFLLVVGGIGSLFTFVPIAFCFTRLWAQEVEATARRRASVSRRAASRAAATAG